MRPSLGIVVVTYESDDVVGECLQSIRAHEPDAAVVVVDNASPSGPPATGGYPLVRNNRNTGYAGGCNRGASSEYLDGCDFLAFLNPDIRLAGPALTDITRQMLGIPSIGAATGTIVDPGGTRRPSAWGRVGALRVFWGTAGWSAERIRRVVGRVAAGGVFTSSASMARTSLEVDGFLIGGALVIRRASFEEVGGFDEEFFMGWDDTDLCERIRQAGWALWVLETAPIVHLGSSSSRGIDRSARDSWYDAGLRLFVNRHLTGARRLSVILAHRIGRAIRPISRYFLRS